MPPPGLTRTQASRAMNEKAGARSQCIFHHCHATGQILSLTRRKRYNFLSEFRQAHGDELRPRRFRPDGQQCAYLAVYGPLRAVIVVHYVRLLPNTR